MFGTQCFKIFKLHMTFWFFLTQPGRTCGIITMWQVHREVKTYSAWALWMLRILCLPILYPLNPNRNEQPATHKQRSWSANLDKKGADLDEAKNPHSRLETILIVVVVAQESQHTAELPAAWLSPHELLAFPGNASLTLLPLPVDTLVSLQDSWVMWTTRKIISQPYIHLQGRRRLED